MASSSQMPQSAPYLPLTAGIGGLPTVGVDVPICAVFIFLFICAAAGHMVILQVNMRRGHKFLMSGLMFGFCMARITTCVMRIVWACRGTNVRVAIAAQIFVAAGVLLLFLINLIFAQRILRAAHPHFGWHKGLSKVFLLLYLLILFMLVAVITVTVQSFYTLDANIHRIDRDIQLTASTYLMFISFLPLPMVILGLIIPREARVDKFGTGHWRTKVRILLTTTVLLCLGAAFRCGTAWMTPRLRDDPAWYHAKWCFYFFNFTLEAIVIYCYLILRVDHRFYVPDGAKGLGGYALKTGNASEAADSQEKYQSADSIPGERRILSEEEVFDDQSPISQRTLGDEEVPSSPISQKTLGDDLALRSPASLRTLRYDQDDNLCRCGK